MKTMPKGSVPMRVRRRQSDAKWRASVAICYDTLKNVIPDNEKLSKRKISKALILQETKKHISNLENHLKELLEQKARGKGRAVLYETDQGLIEACLNTIQDDFALKQQNLYLLNCSQQRKRSSVPSDMEVGLVNLRGQGCDLKVYPIQNLKQAILNKKASIKIAQGSTNLLAEEKSDMNRNLKKNQHILQILAETDGNDQTTVSVEFTVDDAQFVPGSETSQSQDQRSKIKVTEVTYRTEEFFERNTEQILMEIANMEEIKNTEEASLYDNPGYNLLGEVTPSKPGFRMESTSTPRSHVDLYFQSPSKGDVSYILPSDLGITPIKLVRLENHTEPEAQLSPGTLLGLQMQQDEAEQYEIDIEDLLCTESIETMNLEEDVEVLNTNTPNSKALTIKQRGRKWDNISMGKGRSVSDDRRQKSKTREPKCRRKLESIFQDDRVKKPSTVSSCTGSVGDTHLFEDAETCAPNDIESLLRSEDNYEDLVGYNLLSEHAGSTASDTQWGTDSAGSLVVMATTENSQSDGSNYGEDVTELKYRSTAFNDASELETDSQPSVKEKLFSSAGFSGACADLIQAQTVPDAYGNDSFDADFHPLDLNATDELGFFTISNGTSTQTSDQTCSDVGSFCTWSSDVLHENGASPTLGSQVVPQFESIPMETEFIVM